MKIMTAESDRVPKARGNAVKGVNNPMNKRIIARNGPAPPPLKIQSLVSKTGLFNVEISFNKW